MLNLLDSDLNTLRERRETLKAERSLHEFLRQAWFYIEGDVSFVDGWHLQAISEHLEALARRQIRNLLINVPPRCSKSTLISVAFPAWRWIHKPSERFMYTSYSLSLARRDSVRCRRLISSSWYQKKWGHLYKFTGDQNTLSRFDNTQKGYRLTTSTGGTATGDGGSILIADDPNNALDGESEVLREGKIDWWTQVWSTRLNDKKNDCQIVIQQRIHDRDISGFILSHDDKNEWTRLILPMEYEFARGARTIVLPSTNGKIWEDPRTEEGELLCPERIDKKELEALKNTLGEYAAAGQLQQRPSPAKGGIFKRDWFLWWKSDTLPEIQFVIQSWDTATSKKESGSYSACTTWGVFYDENDIENVILLSMWRGRVGYPELRERAKRLYFDYRDIGEIKEPQFTGMRVDMCLIEAKMVGDPLIQDFQAGGIRAFPFEPKTYGDKVRRARFVTPLVEGGRVWLPARKPAYDRLLTFADEFLESVITFSPMGGENDLVDSMSQAFIKLRDGDLLSNPRDKLPYREAPKENPVVY